MVQVLILCLGAIDHDLKYPTHMVNERSHNRIGFHVANAFGSL